MTAADLHLASAATSPAPIRRTSGLWRLGRLHAISRRTPAALGLQTAFGALLAAELRGHWDIAGGPAAHMIFPLTITTGAAAVTAVSTYGPFGEAERGTGRWLPWLRFALALALTATAFGLLAAGAAVGGHLAGGDLVLLRNIVGSTGLGLLSAVAFGGGFGWIGPMAYLLITEVALTGNPTTPWIWAARPQHDRGAAMCVTAVFTAGAIALTTLGERGSRRDNPE